MIRFDIPAETRSVLELLTEMREGRLDLNPEFQRRSVWRTHEKSHLIDTLLRGLPIPMILLRERTDPERRTRLLEVADGQQRLRTIFAFIEPEVLGRDFDPEKDSFTVRKSHNPDPDIYGRGFEELPGDLRRALLDYRMNVVFLPSSMEDRDVLDLFARLNSTGLRLTNQELRNALFSGEFKTLMYRLAWENLERWRSWGVFTGQEIARMKDAELVSDLTNMVLNGIRSKTKKELDDLYRKYDEEFPQGTIVERRFSRLLSEVDNHADHIVGTAFSREMHFYVLVAGLYDEMWGLEAPLTNAKPQGVGSRFWRAVDRVAERYRTGDLPGEVVEASQGAATDLKRRRIRFEFLMSHVNAG